jgi:hypothetical protein
MSKGKVSFKEDALRALSKGDLSRALDHFQKHCSQEPGDLRSRLKMAEVLDRLTRMNLEIFSHKKSERVREALV